MAKPPTRKRRLATTLLIALIGAVAYASYRESGAPLHALRSEQATIAAEAESRLLKRGPAAAPAIVADLLAYAADEDSHRLVAGRLPSDAYFERVTRLLSAIGRDNRAVQTLIADRLLISGDHRVSRVGTDALLATNPEDWLDRLARVANDPLADSGAIAMAIARSRSGVSHQLLDRLWSERDDLKSRGRIAPAIGELGDARFTNKLADVLRHTISGDRDRRDPNEWGAVSAIAAAYDRVTTAEDERVGWVDHYCGVQEFDPDEPALWRFEDLAWHTPYETSPCLPGGGQEPPADREGVFLGLLKATEAGGLVIERERLTVLGDAKVVAVPGRDWVRDHETATLRGEHQRFVPTTDAMEGPIAGSSYALPLRPGRNWFFTILQPVSRPMFVQIVVPDDGDSPMSLHRRVAPSGYLLLACPGPKSP